MYSFTHWPDNCHILCRDEMLGIRKTMNKTQPFFSRILSPETMMWFEAVSGWGDGQQSSPRGEALCQLNPSQLESRAEFHSQKGIKVQDRKPRQTLSSRLNKNSEIEGRGYNLMNRVCTGALPRLLKGKSWAETNFQPHSLWNGPAGWRASVAGWDLAKMNWHLAFI